MPGNNKTIDVSKAVNSAVNILKLIENLSPNSADLLEGFSKHGHAEVGNASIDGRLFGTTNLKVDGSNRKIQLTPENLFSEEISQAFTQLAKDASTAKMDAFFKSIYQAIEQDPHWQRYWRSLDIEPARKQKIHDFALGSLTYMIVGAVQQQGTDALVNEGIAAAKDAKTKTQKDEIKYKVLGQFHKAISKIMMVAKDLSTVNSESVANKFEFDHTNYTNNIANQSAPSLRKSSLFSKSEKRDDIDAGEPKSIPPAIHKKTPT